MKKLLHQLSDQWTAWHLKRDLKAGRKLYGRQDSEKGQLRQGNSQGGVTSAKSRPKASMKLRVYRAATDTWEDTKEVPSLDG